MVDLRLLDGYYGPAMDHFCAAYGCTWGRWLGHPFCRWHWRRVSAASRRTLDDVRVRFGLYSSEYASALRDLKELVLSKTSRRAA